jgi:hypothetical protein
VTFEDGTTSSFSMEKALRAIAAQILGMPQEGASLLAEHSMHWRVPSISIAVYRRQVRPIDGVSDGITTVPREFMTSNHGFAAPGDN